jgi:hypothetical protein
MNIEKLIEILEERKRNLLHRQSVHLKNGEKGEAFRVQIQAEEVETILWAAKPGHLNSWIIGEGK